jgi:DNA-binding response OmpR family regulator
MKGRHLALIVEDDPATAEDLEEILKSLKCESVVVNNKRDALTFLHSKAFCFILLDLEIKHQPDSIKGHIAHGSSLLREIRTMHAERAGVSFWLPILIVSGFARETATAVEVMRDGASDVIQKPFKSREVSDAIYRALERSGRATHDLCGETLTPRVTDAGRPIVLAIPGDRIRRRTRVMVGARPIMLPNSSLKLLLQLMVAHEAGMDVHKRDLGASDDQGFKGVSLLRAELRPVLGEGVDIIGNDYHGNYLLTDEVTIGSCDTEKLAEIGDKKISELAGELRRRLDARRPKSEGNS